MSLPLHLFTQCNALDGKCTISCDNEVNVTLSLPLAIFSVMALIKWPVFSTYSLYNRHFWNMTNLLDQSALMIYDI